MQARIRRGVIFRELGNENTPGPPDPLLQLDQANPRGFQPLAALGDSEGDTFTFIEGGEPGSFKSRDVDEYVHATTIPSDEAEALVDIEPFHGAGLFDRCAGR